MEQEYQNYQAFDIEDKNKSPLCEETYRIQFIRKVYLIITTQLLFTTLMCVITYISSSFQLFLLQNTVLFWLFLILGIIVQIAIFCCRSVAKQVPNNFIALALYTFCQSWIVSYSCAIAFQVYSINGGQLVLIAALLTLGVSAALTVYAFTTETDFTMMGGSLFIFGVVILLLGLFSMIFQSQFIHLLYIGLVTILYGFYLIYDTQIIVGGKVHELDIDDYIIASLIIYTDIIMLFMQILQILLEIFGKRS